MTDSSDPMENRTDAEMHHKPKEIVARLTRRKFALGVALPKIRRRLVRIMRASDRIRKNRRLLDGSPRRERLKSFSTTVRQKKTQGIRVIGRMASKRRQVPWEQLDLSLPNGAPAESTRSNILGAGMEGIGFPTGGQVIAPFSPPAPSDEPSFIKRRQARIEAQEQKKSVTRWKAPHPSSRLFSRVEEIKPSGDEQAGREGEKPPVKDQGVVKFSRPQEGAKKPEITSGKSSTVQRQMAPDEKLLPPGVHKEPRPEPQPAAEDHQRIPPDAPREETQRDLQIPASRKPMVKQGIETPVPSDSNQVARRPRLPEKPEEIRPYQSPPRKAAERTEEIKSQPSPPDRRPSTASVSPATVQREPEPVEKPVPARRPTEEKPAGITESYRPPEEPPAPRKPPIRQEESSIPEKSELLSPSEERPYLDDSRMLPQSRPPVPVQESDRPVPPAASKPAGRFPEKSLARPQLEKPVVFHPVLARLRSKRRQAVGARIVIRDRDGKPVVAPLRIAVRGKSNLIHRQIWRTLPRPSSKTESASKVLRTRQFGTYQPQMLHLSLRPLTASQAKPETREVPLSSSDRTATKNEKPANTQTVVVKQRPLLLSQRNLLLPMNTTGKTSRMGKSSPGEQSSKRPDSAQSISISGARHPWGEKILVTYPGRQQVQRRLRQSSAPGNTLPAGEIRRKPPAPAFSGGTVLQKAVQPVPLSQPAVFSQEVEPEVHRVIRQPVKILKTVVKPTGTEVTKHPAVELPVVHPPKVSPVEQLVQREQAENEPIVESKISKPQVSESSSANAGKEKKRDLQKLARDVYPIIKRMIAIEKERSSGRL